MGKKCFLNLHFLFWHSLLQFLVKHTRHTNSFHFWALFVWNHIYFVHQKCAFTLIEREQRRQNRLGGETLASLLLTRCSCWAPTCCSCSRCEFTHLLTCTPKKICFLHVRSVFFYYEELLHQNVDLCAGRLLYLNEIHTLLSHLLACQRLTLHVP